MAKIDSGNPVPGAPPPVQSSVRSGPVPLDGIPLPPAVVAFAVVAGLALLLAIGRLPGAVAAGVNVERAHRYLESGDAAKAVPLLKKLDRDYPQSIDVEIDLAEAYEKSDQLIDAARLLNSMEGIKLNEEQYDRLTALSKKLDAELPPSGAANP